MKWLFVLLMVLILAIPAAAQDMTGAEWIELSDTEQEIYLMGMRAGMITVCNLLSDYLDTFFTTVAGALHVEYTLGDLVLMMEAFLQKYEANGKYPMSQLLFIVQ